MEINTFDILSVALSVVTPAYLIVYLTMSLVRKETSLTRLLLSAIIIGTHSLLELKLKNPTLLLEIIFTVIALLVAKKEYTFLEFVKVAVIYFIVKLISTALEYLIVFTFDPNDTLLTIIVSISIVLTAFLVKTFDYVTKGHKKIKRIYNVEVFNGNEKCKTKAYLDTGNMLYDKGKPVVIFSPKIVKSLDLKTDREIAVSTINGLSLLNGGTARIKIFLDKKEHKVLPIVYAISDKMNIRGYDVLLHKDMEQL